MKLYECEWYVIDYQLYGDHLKIFGKARIGSGEEYLIKKYRWKPD